MNSRVVFYIFYIFGRVSCLFVWLLTGRCCCTILHWVELLLWLISYDRDKCGVPRGNRTRASNTAGRRATIEPRRTLLSHAAPFGFWQAMRHPISIITATTSRYYGCMGRLQLGHAKNGMVYFSNTVHRLWSGPPDYSPSPRPHPPHPG